MTEVAVGEDAPLRIDITLARRPQHQAADGIGEAATGDAGTLVLESCRCAVVGRQQDVEGRAIVDLRVELAGGAEGQHGAVAGVAGEGGGDFLHWRGEVGRHGHLHVVGDGG